MEIQASFFKFPFLLSLGYIIFILGGPLVINEDGVWTQIGIVSFVSNKGCSSGHPSGYVRTTSFLNWISIHTGVAIRL